MLLGNLIVLISWRLYFCILGSYCLRLYLTTEHSASAPVPYQAITVLHHWGATAENSSNMWESKMPEGGASSYEYFALRCQTLKLDSGVCKQELRTPSKFHSSSCVKPSIPLLIEHNSFMGKKRNEKQKLYTERTPDHRFLWINTSIASSPSGLWFDAHA